MATLAPPPRKTPPAGRPRPTSNAEQRAARIRFRRAVALMLMTLVLPGSAQLVAGNRELGRTVLRTWVLLVVGGLGTVLVAGLWHSLAFKIASTPWLLLVLQVLLVVLALGWVALIVDAWRLGQPLSLSLDHRKAAIALNAGLCLLVACPLLYTSHLVGAGRGALSIFGGTEVVGAHDGRFNVLLLGGDSGAGRWGLRPDSLTVASIDARTGRTVLIGLPRNMQNFPFAKGSVMAEQWPDGWNCDTCYLNAISTWAEDNRSLFGKSKHPGVEATISGVEGITGLKINYWAMVNLQGFKDLVDAVGGVELNVRQRIPVGLPSDDFYTHIEPGKRRLNGFETLWFARARYDSDDYSRMARQKCVMAAMAAQLSPQTVFRNFSDIAKAGSAMVQTNLPMSEVDSFIDLGLKAKAQKISTVSLVPPKVVTSEPDIGLVHDMVEQAIARAEGKSTESKKSASAAAAGGSSGGSTPGGSTGGSTGGSSGGSASGGGAEPQVVTGGSIGSRNDGYAANQADDLAAAC